MFRSSMLFPPPVPKPETSEPPRPISTNDAPRHQESPASSAAKSQPLHNFPLHDLKWTMNHTNTQSISKAAEKSLDPVAQFRGRNPVSEKARSGASASLSETKPDKKKGAAAVDSHRSVERTSTAVDGRSKILIRIPNPKNFKDAAASADVGAGGAAAVDAEENAAVGDGMEVEEFVSKTWNLRPRKPPPKRSSGNCGGALRNSGGTSRTESSRPRNSADAKIAAESKEKKHKFSISLTKMEIDEDIFALTGSKPRRRPKKRAKHVQKQLDGIFPGLWLSSITLDAYKVSEHATKDQLQQKSWSFIRVTSAFPLLSNIPPAEPNGPRGMLHMLCLLNWMLWRETDVDNKAGHANDKEAGLEVHSGNCMKKPQDCFTLWRSFLVDT